MAEPSPSAVVDLELVGKAVNEIRKEEDAMGATEVGKRERENNIIAYHMCLITP